MAKSQMQFNSAFFEDLSHSAAVKQLVDAAADRVLAAAQASAPEDSGDYKAGLRRSSKNQKRYVALVEATDPKSMLIESKTGNLARALRTAKKS